MVIPPAGKSISYTLLLLLVGSMRGQDMQWQSSVLIGYSIGNFGPILAVLNHLFCPARKYYFLLGHIRYWPNLFIQDGLIITGLTLRARGWGFLPATMRVALGYLYNGKWKKNTTKRNPLLFDSLPSCWIYWQLEILVTTLYSVFFGLHLILHGPQLCLGP